MLYEVITRLRHRLGPLDDFAEHFATSVPPGDVPLATALARWIRAELNLEVPLDAFRPDSAPPHLHMNFRVVDEHGRQLAMGRNLADLKQAWAPQTRAALAESASVPEAARHRHWDFGDLAEIMEMREGGQTLVGYPALTDLGDAVTIHPFAETLNIGWRNIWRYWCCENAGEGRQQKEDREKKTHEIV